MFLAENCQRVKKSLSDVCWSAFFVGLVAAASNLPELFLLKLKYISVYSDFGKVIEFREVSLIFVCYFDLFFMLFFTPAISKGITIG